MSIKFIIKICSKQPTNSVLVKLLACVQTVYKTWFGAARIFMNDLEQAYTKKKTTLKQPIVVKNLTTAKAFYLNKNSMFFF